MHFTTTTIFIKVYAVKNNAIRCMVKATCTSMYVRTVFKH